MQWREVVAHPSLRDLPFKIETNERGQIVMTPTKLMHGKYQSLIDGLLQDLMEHPGETVIESAIQTRKGTKVADIAWFSESRWEQVKDEYDSPISPEICVEVISPSNSSDEIQEKKQLYFERGAVEVWTCNAKGTMQFYTLSGEVSSSVLVPQFPKTIFQKR